MQSKLLKIGHDYGWPKFRSSQLFGGQTIVKKDAIAGTQCGECNRATDQTDTHNPHTARFHSCKSKNGTRSIACPAKTEFFNPNNQGTRNIFAVYGSFTSAPGGYPSTSTSPAFGA